MNTAPIPAPDLSLFAPGPALELARLVTLIIASLCLAFAREFCKNPSLLADAGTVWRFLNHAVRLYIALIDSLAASQLPCDRAAPQPPAGPATSGPPISSPPISGPATPSSTMPAASPATRPTPSAQTPQPHPPTIKNPLAPSRTLTPISLRYQN